MEMQWNQERVVTMVVTPQMAEAWLEKHNHINRDMRMSTLEQYGRDLSNGRWKFNGDTITFDWDGELINGQHRLRIICDSGLPMKCIVVTGLDPACRPTVDIQGVRSVADAFDFSGMSSLLGHGTIGKNTAAGMWSRIKYGIAGSKGKETRSELLAFARQYPEGGSFALEEFGAYPRVRSISVAPMMAAVARAWYCYQAPVRLASFVRILCTGLQTRTEDQTVIVLREGVLRGHGKNSNAQQEIYGKTARAIQAYMAGKIITKIYKPTEEPFPLPVRTSSSSTASVDRVDRNAGQLFARGSSSSGVAQAARAHSGSVS